MWQVAVLWCYVEGVITVKVAVVNNQHLQLTNHLYCCILLVFSLHALLTMHGHRNIKLTYILLLLILFRNQNKNILGGETDKNTWEE